MHTHPHSDRYAHCLCPPFSLFPSFSISLSLTHTHTPHTTGQRHSQPDPRAQRGCRTLSQLASSRCKTLQHVAPHCNTLQRSCAHRRCLTLSQLAATRWKVSHHVAPHYTQCNIYVRGGGVSHEVKDKRQFEMRCSALQHTATQTQTRLACEERVSCIHLPFSCTCCSVWSVLQLLKTHKSI